MNSLRSARIGLIAVLGLMSAVPASRAAEGPGSYLKRPEAWFASDEARRVAGNVLSYQSDLGGWPKNVDTTAEPYRGDRKALKPTFDNGATTGELRFLAGVFRATKDDRYRKAFEKGLDYILNAQYPTGGWPQFYPPTRAYHRHITFNDNAMTRLMELVRDVAAADAFAFVDAPRRDACRVAFNRGIDCILRCQVRVDGKRTAWCAQHDEVDYRPRPARTFELASLSGAESVGIVRLLMGLDHPKPEVVESVESAVGWFRTVQRNGVREVVRQDAAAPGGMDRVVVSDPSASGLWARFYEIGTNRPLFADRDGVPRFSLAEIGHERRNGYAWYGTWPRQLLDREYPAWRQRWVADSTAPNAAASQGKTVEIVLVGDSTVAEGSGWGPGFAARLGAGARCVNMARGGRSSKSYRQEGHWARALELKPDYVLIQFGHNDQPGKGPERETDPKTTFRQNLARYVDEARAAGAKPILVTSMTRRNFTSDGKIRPDGLADYAAATRAVAMEKQVPLVDLHASSVAYVERLGPVGALPLDMESKDPKKPDRTHLSPRGSAAMAGLVIDQLRIVLPSLAAQLP